MQKIVPLHPRHMPVHIQHIVATPVRRGRLIIKFVRHHFDASGHAGEGLPDDAPESRDITCRNTQPDRPFAPAADANPCPNYAGQAKYKSIYQFS